MLIVKEKEKHGLVLANKTAYRFDCKLQSKTTSNILTKYLKSKQYVDHLSRRREMLSFSKFSHFCAAPYKL